MGQEYTQNLNDYYAELFDLDNLYEECTDPWD